MAGNSSCTRCTPLGTAGYLIPVASAADTRMVMCPFEDWVNSSAVAIGPQRPRNGSQTKRTWGRGKKQDNLMDGEWCPRGHLDLLPLRQWWAAKNTYLKTHTPRSKTK